jgi:hypothetical protein
MARDAQQSSSSSRPQRKYSPFGRPFRLQLSSAAASGFAAPASRGKCQAPGCSRFEWCKGANYCRDCWLCVHKQERLPDRLV